MEVPYFFFLVNKVELILFTTSSKKKEINFIQDLCILDSQLSHLLVQRMQLYQTKHRGIQIIMKDILSRFGKGVWNVFECIDQRIWDYKENTRNAQNVPQRGEKGRGLLARGLYTNWGPSALGYLVWNLSRKWTHTNIPARRIPGKGHRIYWRVYWGLGEEIEGLILVKKLVEGSWRGMAVILCLLWVPDDKFRRLEILRYFQVFLLYSGKIATYLFDPILKNYFRMISLENDVKFLIIYCYYLKYFYIFINFIMILYFILMFIKFLFSFIGLFKLFFNFLISALIKGHIPSKGKPSLFLMENSLLKFFLLNSLYFACCFLHYVKHFTCECKQPVQQPRALSISPNDYLGHTGQQEEGNLQKWRLPLFSHPESHILFFDLLGRVTCNSPRPPMHCSQYAILKSYTQQHLAAQAANISPRFSSFSDAIDFLNGGHLTAQHSSKVISVPTTHVSCFERKLILINFTRVCVPVNSPQTRQLQPESLTDYTQPTSSATTTTLGCNQSQHQYSCFPVSPPPQKKTKKEQRIDSLDSGDVLQLHSIAATLGTGTLHKYIIHSIFYTSNFHGCFPSSSRSTRLLGELERAKSNLWNSYIGSHMLRISPSETMKGSSLAPWPHDSSITAFSTKTQAMKSLSRLASRACVWTTKTRRQIHIQTKFGLCRRMERSEGPTPATD
ncbi:hypothetical protein VP01_144g1 [Puccinia sorghi]|uniref:Uncharacterized protein n=1 Tax=Puccinia sorghi TaxID=27349 RepID=A0A0L6VK18_9BASI|nr:hypothetical protein VP01_144g1 [Puccinia sorghi]